MKREFSVSRSLLMFMSLAIAASWTIQRHSRRIGIEQPIVQLVQFPGAGGAAFDFSQTSIPVAEIHSGGPPKDGIPALSNPKFIVAAEATYLSADDRVIGVISGTETRAYPLAILNYHEVINDTVGELPIAVTYCPLCDSAVVFDRRTPLGEREFGVSGLLYNSNVLMYDRGGPTESLWSQVKTEGVSGPAVQQTLATLPFELTTWGDWRARYPLTHVLSTQTGHRRNYKRSPYAAYFSNPKLMFPVKPVSNELPSKTRVLGVWTDGVARAYTESMFSRDRRRFSDDLNGKKFTVEYNPENRSLRIANADAGVHWMYSLWFAWYAFHPETEVFRAP